jgi:phage-related protein
MSDGEITIDVLLDKTAFEKEVSNLASISKQATIAFVGAAAGAAAVGAAIWTTANAAAEAGDRIDKMSQRVGLSRVAFQEWDYILAQNGGNIESLQMGIKSLTDKVDLALSGNEEAIKSFAALGVSLSDLQSKTREQIFESVIRGLQGMTDEQKRAALGGDLLSRAYIDLAPTLGQTAEETEKLRQRAHDLNLIMGDDAVNAGVVFGDTLDDLKKVFQQVVFTIGAEFLPALTRIMEWIAVFVGNKERMEAMVALFKLTMVAIAAASAGLAAYGVSLLALNASLIITTAAQWALNLAMSLNPVALVIGLVVALGVALLALSGVMGDFVLAIVGYFEEFLGSAVSTFSSIASWLTVNIPAAIAATILAFKSFQTSLGVVFAYVTERVYAMIATMNTWATGFKSSIKTVADYLATLPNLITAVLSGAWDAFTAGAASLIARVRDVMLSLANTIVNSIAELPAIMYQAGVNIVMGLWNGLKAQIDALISWLISKIAEIAALAGSVGASVSSVSSYVPSGVSSLTPSLAALSAGNNITFTQIINSPVSLSPSEIAREAENSLTLWGLK